MKKYLARVLAEVLEDLIPVLLEKIFEYLSRKIDDGDVNDIIAIADVVTRITANAKQEA
ncbi:hypothetical protein LCGC14_0859910 [marine sediment metagenome]|uniref:Uncharacterized protein n=1 Tax=marine sediment metagenome TaxID=412755 RepID=A0A0F9RSF0_9ZZZZ